VASLAVPSSAFKQTIKKQVEARLAGAWKLPAATVAAAKLEDVFEVLRGLYPSLTSAWLRTTLNGWVTHARLPPANGERRSCVFGCCAPDSVQHYLDDTCRLWWFVAGSLRVAVPEGVAGKMMLTHPSLEALIPLATAVRLYHNVRQRKLGYFALVAAAEAAAFRTNTLARAGQALHRVTFSVGVAYSSSAARLGVARSALRVSREILSGIGEFLL